MDADGLVCNLTLLPAHNSSSTGTVFCNLDSFKEFYKHIHGYLAMIICLIGIVFNILNILVLTSKLMRSNPINLILTGIAVADIFMMVEFIPFAVHIYMLDNINCDR